MFITPLASIPQAVSVERRRARRIKVLLSVGIRSEDGSQIVRVIELSRTGARIQSGKDMRAGEPLILGRGCVEIEARVAWTKGQTAGLEFLGELDERSLLTLKKATG